jgi:hypothetical protein
MESAREAFWLKHITDIDVDGKSIRAFQIGSDRLPLSLNADLYNDKLSFYWELSINTIDFFNSIEQFYRIGLSGRRLPTTNEGLPTAFIREPERQEPVKRALNLESVQLTNVILDFIRPELDRGLIDFCVFDSGECRFWGEVNSIDGPGKRIGIVTGIDLSELITIFYFRTLIASILSASHSSLK